MPVRVDPDPVVEAYKANFDRSSLQKSLQLSPEARILELMALQRIAEEADKAGRRLRRG